VHAEPSHWLHEISMFQNCSSPFLAGANNTPITNWGYLFLGSNKLCGDILWHSIIPNDTGTTFQVQHLGTKLLFYFLNFILVIKINL
jgi:hypothetical protein